MIRTSGTSLGSLKARSCQKAMPPRDSTVEPQSVAPTFTTRQ